jgi:hypothetical protein
MYSQPIRSKPKRRWPWVLIGLAVLLVLGCVGMGAILAGAGPSNNGIDVYDTPSIQAVPNTGARPTVAKPKPEQTIREGDWVVGEDVPPGRYRTPGAKKSIITLCTWTVAPNEDAEPQDFGTSDKTDEPGRVTLKKGNVFETSGCQDWVRQ